MVKIHYINNEGKLVFEMVPDRDYRLTARDDIEYPQMMSPSVAINSNTSIAVRTTILTTYTFRVVGAIGYSEVYVASRDHATAKFIYNNMLDTHGVNAECSIEKYHVHDSDYREHIEHSLARMLSKELLKSGQIHFEVLRNVSDFTGNKLLRATVGSKAPDSSEKTWYEVINQRS